MSGQHDLHDLLDFLPCATPVAWVEAASRPEHLPTLLVDHANCEKKAASTALALMHRYPMQHTLLHKLSRLAREELRHFEQVIDILRRRNIPYTHVSASRYAAGLHACVRREEPDRLVDSLLLGGIIEARSCERFAVIAPRLDEELGAFYRSLLKSEARHFRDYLTLAEGLAGADAVRARLLELLPVEQNLVTRPDADLRFHSGPLAVGASAEAPA